MFDIQGNKIILKTIVILYTYRYFYDAIINDE